MTNDVDTFEFDLEFHNPTGGGAKKKKGAKKKTAKKSAKKSAKKAVAKKGAKKSKGGKKRK